MSRLLGPAHAVRLGLLTLTALALVGVALVAQEAQPGADKTVRMGLPTHALQYLGNAALLKELNVSAEQKSKLVEFRTKWWNDFFALDVKDHDAKLPAMSAAADKELAQIFTPEQLKRLQQITVQQTEKRWGAGRAVRLPVIAEALKLSPEQIDRLAKGEEVPKVLSDTQQKEWAQMRGQPFEAALRVSFPGGALKGKGIDKGKGFAPSHPGLTSLAAEAVRRELALGEEQVKGVADLQEKWSKAIADLPAGPAAERAKQAAALRPDYDKAIAGLLQPEQHTRHVQILLQQQIRFLDGAAVYKNAAVAKGIGLTDEQRQDLDKLDGERLQGLAAVILADRPLEEVLKEVAAHKKASAGLIDKVITAEQHARMKELVGKPFEGFPKGGKGKGGGGGGFFTGPLSAYDFSLSMVVSPFLSNTALQGELKLTDEQMTQLTKLRTKWTADKKMGQAGLTDEALAKKVRELSQGFLKELTAVVSPEQAKRILQVGLQLTSGQGGGFLGSMTANFVEVEDGLKLTKEQLVRIRNGEGLSAVLTKEQQGLWKELLGPPIKSASLPFGGPGFAGRSLPERLHHVNHAEVQKDLMLSEEHIKQVQALVAQWQQNPPTPAAAVRERTAAVNEAIDKMLKPEQQKRLQQIRWQQLRKRGMDQLLTLPEFGKAVGVSDKQQEQVRAIIKEHMAIEDLLFSELRPGGVRRRPGRPREAGQGHHLHAGPGDASEADRRPGERRAVGAAAGADGRVARPGVRGDDPAAAVRAAGRRRVRRAA